MIAYPRKKYSLRGASITRLSDVFRKPREDNISAPKGANLLMVRINYKGV